MQKKFDITTVGGGTIDIMFYVEDGQILPNPRKEAALQKLICFEYGAKIGIEESYFTFGGGANNAAVSLARLGQRTNTLLAVGSDDNGKAVINNLKKNKVQTKFIQKLKKAKTGFSFILTLGHGEERTIFLYRGANDFLNIKTQIKKMKSDWFYVSSLGGKDWVKILAGVAGRGKMAWNPGSRQIKAGRGVLAIFLQKTEVLLVNKEEAIDLLQSDNGYKSKNSAFFDQPKNLLSVLKSWGPKIVVITDGGKGAYVYDGAKYYYSPAASESGKVVDRTGVGDAFGSAFVAGLKIYNYDIEKSLKLALVNSAAVTTEIGAQNKLLTLKEAEVEMAKRKWEIKLI